jgi:hypothetical protein
MTCPDVHPGTPDRGVVMVPPPSDGDADRPAGPQHHLPMLRRILATAPPTRGRRTSWPVQRCAQSSCRQPSGPRHSAYRPPSRCAARVARLPLPLRLPRGPRPGGSAVVPGPSVSRPAQRSRTPPPRASPLGPGPTPGGRGRRRRYPPGRCRQRRGPRRDWSGTTGRRRSGARRRTPPIRRATRRTPYDITGAGLPAAGGRPGTRLPAPHVADPPRQRASRHRTARRRRAPSRSTTSRRPWVGIVPTASRSSYSTP